MRFPTELEDYRVPVYKSYRTYRSCRVGYGKLMEVTKLVGKGTNVAQEIEPPNRYFYKGIPAPRARVNVLHRPYTTLGYRFKSLTELT